MNTLETFPKLLKINTYKYSIFKQYYNFGYQVNEVPINMDPVSDLIIAAQGYIFGKVPTIVVGGEPRKRREREGNYRNAHYIPLWLLDPYYIPIPSVVKSGSDYLSRSEDI